MDHESKKRKSERITWSWTEQLRSWRFDPGWLSNTRWGPPLNQIKLPISNNQQISITPPLQRANIPLSTIEKLGRLFRAGRPPAGSQIRAESCGFEPWRTARDADGRLKLFSSWISSLHLQADEMSSSSRRSHVIQHQSVVLHELKSEGLILPDQVAAETLTPTSTEYESSPPNLFSPTRLNCLWTHPWNSDSCC